MDIHLNDFEIQLFDSIAFPPEHESLGGDAAANNAELARILTVSLVERDAIPPHRLRVFDDPAYGFHDQGSARDVLQRSGATGDAVFEDPAFLKYLRYFICGPELPDKVARVFRRELVERGGGGHRRLAAKVAELSQTLGASDVQREKFFMQALELGLSPALAREIAHGANAPGT